jgi:phosphohistidine phosphatase
MKKLSILRHAKADRPENYANDFDRKLTSRGHKDAALMADIVTQLEPPVDWIVSSPAQRAKETTEHLVRKTDLSESVFWEPNVYEAHAATLLKILADVPPERNHALLVGHNPGLSDLVSALCAGSQTRVNIDLATTGLAVLTLEIAWWNQIRLGCGRLELLLRPKLLRD